MKQNKRSALGHLVAASLCAALAGLGGCGGPGSRGQPPASNLPATKLPAAVADAVSRNAVVPERTVAANNRFAFRALAELRRNAAAGDNVFVSPTSLALALEIAYNGARGDTATGMAQALSLGTTSADALNADNAALQASLLNPDPAATLNIANSLWLRSGAVKPEFVAINQKYYGSEIGDVAGAPANVNAWVNRKTAGKIPTVLPAGDYSETIAMLVNAVYFNATWTHPFNPDLTEDAPFTLNNGSKLTVRMMHADGLYGYVKGDHFQAVRLPYGTGRLNMLLILPDSDSSLDRLLTGLTPELWVDWLSRFQDKTGAIGLPKSKSSYGATMNDTLKALGMELAFDRNRADLSGLAQVPNRNVYIEAVYHKTFLRMDEKGTEAAVATGVTTHSIGIHLVDFHLTLDRPFLCAIQDKKTGVILFLGTIVRPSS